MFRKRKGRSAGRSRGGDDSADPLAVSAFISRMEAVADADAAAVAAGRPAVAKLRLLPLAVSTLAAASTARLFLDKGVLGVLRQWMEPRDGALPSPALREGVLSMLAQLPVDASDERRRGQLKASGVGRVVLFYSRLPEETPANRRAARSLVERWSRPVFEAHREDLADGGGEEARGERERGALEARAAAAAAAAARNAPIGGAAGAAAAAAAAAARRRAAPPRAPRLDYVVKPRSDAAEGTGGGGSKRGEASKVEGRLKAMQRRAKAGAPRAARISVEGRGL